jgi:ribosomal protein S27AE
MCACPNDKCADYARGSGLICLRCDGEHFTSGEREVIQEVHSKDYKVRTSVMVCDRCGWFTVGVGQMDELLRKTKALVAEDKRSVMEEQKDIPGIACPRCGRKDRIRFWAGHTKAWCGNCGAEVI